MRSVATSRSKLSSIPVKTKVIPAKHSGTTTESTSNESISTKVGSRRVIPPFDFFDVDDGVVVAVVVEFLILLVGEGELVGWTFLVCVVMDDFCLDGDDFSNTLKGCSFTSSTST